MLSFLQTENVKIIYRPDKCDVMVPTADCSSVEEIGLSV